jgi:ZU5 domain
MKQHARKSAAILVRLGALFVLLALAACGGATPPTNSTGIGPSGGTVTGPGGAKVVIPQGALSQNTEIAIAQTGTGAPALPPNVTTVGAMFAFTPHGTIFNAPVTVTMPFDISKLPAGSTPVLLKTNAAQSTFETVVGATVSGSTMTAQVSSFSFLQVVIPTPPDPDREPDPEPEPTSEASYDFTATVTEGSSQGLTLEGTLNLTFGEENDDGSRTVTGELETVARAFPVTGTLAIGNSLEFELILDFGEGISQSLTCEGIIASDGNISGTFTGPSSDDRGTWTATVITASNNTSLLTHTSVLETAK